MIGQIKRKSGRAQLLTLVIPAIREAEVRRITVQGQPEQKVCKIHLNK
jgi:hypothetical protein